MIPSARIAVIAKAVVLLASGAAAIYGALGVLQALSLYQGSQALWNVNVWSSLVLLALITAALVIWPAIVLIKPKKGLPRGTAFWLLIAVFAAWPLAKELLAIDACLDVGGSYDSVRAQCSMLVSYPYTPLYRTRGFFIFASAIAALLAALSFVSSKLMPPATQSAA
jgi:hypothetical protein